MRIQSLEVVGFKSFAERTRLEFPDGITAIVGPNGCGKSNIVDALMWALGEQSTKRLRGRTMEDLLFAGSDSLKQVGLAEVQVTFSVNGDALPAPYKGYPALKVGRRVYRSGESEYSINDTICRLKDITDVFLGTGIGSRTYSVIEQGRVSQLIGAKPQDRRAFIEEVAGISRYRGRRLEAERKMEASQQNLQHVDAILTELERQVGSLARQAKKAERYEQHRSEIRALDANLTTRHVALLAAERSGQTALLDALDREQDVLTYGLSTLEADLERIRLELVGLDRSARESDARHHAVALRLKQAEQSLEYARAERARIADRSSRLEEDRRTLDVLSVELNERGEAARVRRAEAVAAFESATAHRAEIDEGLRTERAVQAGLELELDERRSAHFGLLNARSMLENELKALEKREALLHARLDRKQADRETTAHQVAGLSEGAATSSNELDHLNRHREALAVERQDVRDRLTQRRTELEAAVQALDGLRTELTRAESRFASLEESIRRREGMTEGARRILAEPAGRTGTALGTVSDVVATDDAYTRAVEAWLGPALEYVLVDELRDGLPWVELLKREGVGRAGLAPLEVTSSRVPSEPGPVGPGVAGRMRDLVRVAEPHRAIVHELLGDAWIVANIELAVALRESGSRVPLVTLDGDLLLPSGIVQGGSSERDAAGPLAQRNEMRRLEGDVARLRGELEERLRERHHLSADVTRLEERFEELGRAVERGEARRIEAVRTLGTAEAALRRQRELIETLAFEIDEVLRERAQIATERAAHEDQLATTIEASERLRADLDAGHARRHEVVAAIEALAAELLEATGREAAAQEERRARERERKELDERLKEIEARLAASADEQRGLSARLEDLERSAADSERVLVTDGAERVRLEVEQHELAAASDRTRSTIGELDARARSTRTARASVHEAIQAEQVRRAEIDIRTETLVQGYQDRYGVPLDAPACATPSSEVEAARWTARLEDLKRRVHQMGEVNPGAVEEHRQVLERRDFYATQRADLTKSLDELSQAIASINRTTRKRFREAFDQVRESFQQVFPRLFPGGHGDLQLTEGADLLEAGIEIAVRPAGKKLQSIDLLSGGEKALAALALMFAILKVKPSPFCLLDEVDAPLDEANIGRFSELVRELATESQVVVITHSKKTMGVADRLYGVTMPRPGVSQVVGVNLN